MELTNDEAIKTLETMLKGIDNQPFTYNEEKTMAIVVTGEALRMAIEALKNKEAGVSEIAEEQKVQMETITQEGR